MNRPRVAIIFHRLGPYHVARLRAAADRMDLLAIEEVAETTDYAWDPVSSDGGFQCVTLFAAREDRQTIRRELIRRMEAALDQHQPEVVAIPGWSDPGGLAALAWALRRGSRVVVMSESTVHDHRRRPWKEWVKRQIVALCDAALVGGTPHHEYAVELGMDPARIHSGYDVVDNAYFQTGAALARNQPGEQQARALPPRYFLASNRFLPQKNLFVLLEAFARYRRETGADAWKMVLLGDGPLKAEILSRCAAWDLGEALLLPGFKQYAELPAYYGLAGAFVHAARSEPWGLVVNEALAAGMPVVVSSACGCVRDLVRDGENGFVFDPDDVSRLTVLLGHVAAAGESRRAQMAQAGREIISHWPAARFAEGLQLAAVDALAAPRPAVTWIDRLLLRWLTRV